MNCMERLVIGSFVVVRLTLFFELREAEMQCFDLTRLIEFLQMKMLTSSLFHRISTLLRCHY